MKNVCYNIRQWALFHKPIMTPHQNEPQAVNQYHAALDEIRILSSLAVIIQHVYGMPLDALTHNHTLWWIQTTHLVLFSWAVPVFILLSGALLITTPQESWLSWYSKRLTRVGIPGLLWLGIYGCAFHFFRGDSLALPDIAHRVVFGPVGHLHFLFAIMGLYAITPALVLLKARLSSNEFMIITLLFLALGICTPAVSSTFQYFLPYIGMYMLGAVLVTYTPSFSYWNFALVWILSSCSLLLLKAGMYFYTDHTATFLFHILADKPGIFMVVSATAVFCFLKEAGLIRAVFPSVANASLQKLAALSFGVYLVHPLVLKALVVVYGMVSVGSGVETVPWKLQLLLLLPTYLGSNLIVYVLCLRFGWFSLGFLFGFFDLFDKRIGKQFKERSFNK
jgi:surface polysaccharide O-acyltransferase-like enzyme